VVRSPLNRAAPLHIFQQFYDFTADSAEVKDPVFGPGGSEVTVILRNGRQIRCRDGIGEDALARLIRLVETA
jgi:predicted choloylglycine hydrolase